jgi:hypothetical protein
MQFDAIGRTVALVMLFSNMAIAEPIKEDKTHVRVWNDFAEQILELHKKLVKELPVKQETVTGGYAHMPEFYREENYYHEDKLISRVQWEIETDDLHVIEVFIRDDQGRVIRDYTAAYLPEYHNAPVQTLVSFHGYNGGLHAFRSFDASGELVIERCTGELDGEEVNLMVDLDQIFQASMGNDDIQETPEYKACFAGLPEEPGKYLTPQ